MNSGSWLLTEYYVEKVLWFSQAGCEQLKLVCRQRQLMREPSDSFVLDLPSKLSMYRHLLFSSPVPFRTSVKKP